MQEQEKQVKTEDRTFADSEILRVASALPWIIVATDAKGDETVLMTCLARRRAEMIAAAGDRDTPNYAIRMVDRRSLASIRDGKPANEGADNATVPSTGDVAKAIETIGATESKMLDDAVSEVSRQFGVLGGDRYALRKIIADAMNPALASFRSLKAVPSPAVGDVNAGLREALQAMLDRAESDWQRQSSVFRVGRDGYVPPLIEQARAALTASESVTPTNNTSCVCGHAKGRHDPEDGNCEAHASDGSIGVCRCKRFTPVTPQSAPDPLEGRDPAKVKYAEPPPPPMPPPPDEW